MTAKVFAVTALVWGLMTAPVAAQSSQQENTPASRDPLSFTVGDALRFNVMAKLQSDFHNLSPDIVRDNDGFDLTRRRIGVEGVFLKHFEFQVEREIRREDPWRDVYVDFQYFRNAQVRSGKFKMPFGMDQLTNPTRLDFVYRSRIGDLLSPGRDIGVAVHGRFWGRGLGYEAGVFQHDGDKSRFQENPGADFTAAGRVTVRPFRRLTPQSLVNDLELGVNTTMGTVPEGLHGLRGRTTFSESFFDPVYVKGTRVRLGMDLNWTPGPFSVKGELIRLQDERQGQGLFGEDLPELVSNGWYMSGTWLATGERKDARVEPRRPLFQGGFGALELAARYEELQFGSRRSRAIDDIAPASHPRAANLVPVSYGAWTIGINWYVNRWVRAQANVIRENGVGTLFPDATEPLKLEPFFSYVCRLQFSL